MHQTWFGDKRAQSKRSNVGTGGTPVYICCDSAHERRLACTAVMCDQEAVSENMGFLLATAESPLMGCQMSAIASKVLWTEGARTFCRSRGRICHSAFQVISTSELGTVLFLSWRFCGFFMDLYSQSIVTQHSGITTLFLCTLCTPEVRDNFNLYGLRQFRT